MKKRLLSLLLAVLMIVTLLPTTALAENIVYDIWVNGVSFTDENISSGIPCGKGIATLAPPARAGQPYVLTLTNATISTPSVDDTARAGIAAYVDDLTIVLEGTNVINIRGNKSETAPGYGVYALKNLTIESGEDGGSLTASAKNSNKYCTGIRAIGRLTNKADISGSADNYGIRAGAFYNDGTAYAYGSTYALYAEVSDAGVNNGTITAQNDSAGEARAICLQGSYTNNGTITATANANGSMFSPKYGIFCSADDAVFTNNGTLKLAGGAVGISYPNGTIDIGEKSYVDSYGGNASIHAGKALNIPDTLSVEFEDSTQRRIIIGREYPYDIWVNGVRLTTRNPAVACGDGTATIAEHANNYDEPYVLTLENAEITDCFALDTEDEEENMCGIYSACDLKIVLNGDNSVAPSDAVKPGAYNTGILADGDLVIASSDKSARLWVSTVDADECDGAVTTGIDVGGDFENDAALTVDCGTAEATVTGLSVSGSLSNHNTLTVNTPDIDTYGGVSAICIKVGGNFANDGDLTVDCGTALTVSGGLSIDGCVDNEGSVWVEIADVDAAVSSVAVGLEAVGDFDNSSDFTVICGDAQDVSVGLAVSGQLTNEGSLLVVSGDVSETGSESGSIVLTGSKSSIVNSGEITAVSGNASGNNGLSCAIYGITDRDPAIINSGKINLAAGNSTASGCTSCGVLMGGGIANEGEMTVRAGATNDLSAGITGLSVGGELKNDGELTVECGSAEDSSVGISAFDKLSNSGTLDVTGGSVSAEYGRSCGIVLEADGADLINSGKLNTAGGTVSGDSGLSCGIYGTEYSDVEITNNSLMSVIGGDISGEVSGGRSYGVSLNEGSLINCGTLHAAAGSAQAGAENSGGCGIYLSGDFINQEYAAADIAAVSVDNGVGIRVGGKIQTAEHSLLTAKGIYISAMAGSLVPDESQQALGSTDPDAADDELSAVELISSYVFMEGGTDVDDLAKILKIADKDKPAANTVSFDSNGGSGEMADVTDVSDTYTLPDCSFTPPAGKQFKVWAAGSADGAQYPAGATCGIAADTTFYALWEDLPVIVTEIEITSVPDKTSYFEGESFDADGMVVTATYSDGSSRTVTSYTVEPSGALAAADSSVEVQYTEHGITVTATQSVTVTKSVITAEKASAAFPVYGTPLDECALYTVASNNPAFEDDLTVEWKQPDGSWGSEAPAAGLTLSTDGTVSTAETTPAGEYTFRITNGEPETVDTPAANTPNPAFVSSDAVTLTVEKAVVTVKAKDLKACVGDSLPDLKDDGYTVTGLVGSDTLDTAPTLGYDGQPNMNKAGVYVITVSGDADAAGGNYLVLYQSGRLTVSEPHSADTYTLTFNTNGGSAIAGVSGEFNQVIDLSKYITEKDGAVFDGWYADAALTVPVEKVVLGSDKTVYAKWLEIVPGGTFPFPDVHEDDWSYDDIYYVWEEGLMDGVSPTAFAPADSTTRAMIVTILYRLEGQPVVNYAMSFKDVPADSWYAEAIRWAQATGVVEGYSAERFDPTGLVTREQLATILYRYAKLKGEGFRGSWYFPLDFADREQISSWADEAVHWCSMKKIVEGRPGKLFDPQGYAIRAEAAAMIRRFCETLGDLSAGADTVFSGSATVEGAIFGGAADDRIAAAVTFDTKWLTEQDNRSYNPELAQFCALLSADSYFREKDYAKQKQNRVLFDDFSEPDYTFTSFLTNVGFTEAEHYESYLSRTDSTDTDDSVTLTIGHQTVDGKYDVYALVIRGSYSAGEWRSAFDPGCAGSTYTDLTGEHPDWTDTDHFKGMDVAASRALAYVEDFMVRTGDASLPDRLLITGHSRGGGAANLLGAYFEKDADVTSYTYTFNTPGVTFADDAKSYDTIFNIFDSGDFFAEALPFADGSFARYGADLAVSVSESDEIKAALAALKGRSDYLCASAETVEEYRALFAERFPDRDMLCDKETLTRTYTSAEEAEAGREELLTLIGAEAGLSLGGLCTVGEVVPESDGSYCVTLEYCGAALLRTYAMVMAYGEAAYTAAVSLFDGDEAGCGIAALLVENAAEINGAHLLVNSYVIAGSLK